MNFKTLAGSGDKIGLLTLYTGAALLVLPWLGFLLDSWLGVPLGIAVYVGSWLFVAEEERTLAKTFGVSWGEYCARVKMP
jgi:protein-S-isoprenylcysteine O-methyltransferase Ste14